MGGGEKLEIFDSTLRDGAQGGHVNFSGEDKFKVLKALDSFGVDYIEAGNPASNPKDADFFKSLLGYKFKCARLVAFGSTRKKDCRCEEDRNVAALSEAPVEYVSIFGKSWDLHVRDILKTTEEENLLMIGDTVRYFSGLGRKVFYDAEHFFDGCINNEDYALKSIVAAAKAGALRVVLCDTNGGCFPEAIAHWTRRAAEALKDFPECKLGIHCHNDTGCAVANSMAAVGAGAVQIQGTFTGIGERCGNANLATLIGNLQLKSHYNCVDRNSLPLLTKTSLYISEVANLALGENAPFVGKNAFAHKGGMHVDGVAKNSTSFEHVPPESVGNQRRFLLSEMAGRTAILSKLQGVAPFLERDSEDTARLIELLKEREYQGFQYEAAEASFELLVKRHLGGEPDFFKLVYFKLLGEKSSAEAGNAPSSAMVKVQVGEAFQLAAAEGEGPVNAIDTALKDALKGFYPILDTIHLTDYKVRVMDGKAATAAIVRVLIETTDGVRVWNTVGASSDIINASVMAIVDSILYKLAMEAE